MKKAFLVLLIILALMGIVMLVLNFMPDRSTSGGEYEEGTIIVCYKKDVKAEDAINNIKTKGDKVGAVLTTEPMVISVVLSKGQDAEEAAAGYEEDRHVDFAQPNYAYTIQENE